MSPRRQCFEDYSNKQRFNTIFSPFFVYAVGFLLHRGEAKPCLDDLKVKKFIINEGRKKVLFVFKGLRGNEGKSENKCKYFVTKWGVLAYI